MPKNKFLNDFEKGQIDAYHKSGQSNCAIGRLLNRSETVVRSYLKKRENYGKNHAGGRPNPLTDRQKRLFLKDITVNKLTISQAKAINNISASVSTLWKELDKCPNVKHSKMMQNLALKDQHIRDRLNWAQNQMIWTSQWHDVIFTDEKKFNLDGPDGYKYYWHDIRKEPQWYTKRTAGGGSVNVWAGVGYSGRTHIVILNRNLNGQYYTEVLDMFLMPFATQITGESWVLQQDNSSVHRSNLVSEWMKTKNVKLLDWASLMPEMNIIENVWGYLVRRIYSNGRQYSTVNELKQAIYLAWEEMPQNYVQTLFDSLPTRVFKLIMANGRKIDY